MNEMNEITTLINLTPHEINIHCGSEVISVPPSGTLARCAEVRTEVGRVTDIPVTRVSYGEVSGLPEPDGKTGYIVSALVAQAVKGRGDVFIPGPAVRDEAGRIVGCLGLSVV